MGEFSARQPKHNHLGTVTSLSGSTAIHNTEFPVQVPAYNETREHETVNPFKMDTNTCHWKISILGHRSY